MNKKTINVFPFFVQNQSMSLTPHLQGSTSPVSTANDGQLGPGIIILLLFLFNIRMFFFF